MRCIKTIFNYLTFKIQIFKYLLNLQEKPFNYQILFVQTYIINKKKKLRIYMLKNLLVATSIVH